MNGRPEVVGALFMAAGFFAALGAVLDWDWFLNHRKAHSFVAILGRGGARCFYLLLGVVLIALGVAALKGMLPSKH